MCGIAGIFYKWSDLDGSARRRVERMLAHMRTRGPDAAKVMQVGPSAILGANRLRITDTRADADMPLTTPDSRYAVVQNGEIYNHKDIRALLPRFPYRTRGDTEAIMAAYDRWGTQFIDHLEGMFSLCVFDREKDCFVLAVDPSKEKPLFYYEDARQFVFCSDLGGLLAAIEEPLDFNVAAIQETIAQRYVRGDETHIAGVRKLPNGCMLTVGRGRNGAVKRYYRLPVGDQTFADVDAVRGKIAAAVENSCAKTFALGVPAGFLLSGGVDSSVVVSLAHKAGLPLKTYSVGFERPAGAAGTFDEFEYSRKVAALYGSDHTELVLTADAYCDYLDRWAALTDEPILGLEIVCLLHLYEAAAAECKVVFSGCGPDEIFEGYQYGRKAAGNSLSDIPAVNFAASSFLRRADAGLLLDDGGATERRCHEKIEAVLALYPDIADPLQMVQALNFHTRAPEFEYRKTDITSMHFSIEGRKPFLYKTILKEAFDFDPALKLRGGEEKWIFKQAMRAFVPDEIALRKKEAFPVPDAIMFSPAFEARMSVLLDGGTELEASGAIDGAYMRTLWDAGDADHRFVFYRLYVMEKVLARHKDRLVNAPHLARTVA